MNFQHLSKQNVWTFGKCLMCITLPLAHLCYIMSNMLMWILKTKYNRPMSISESLYRSFHKTNFFFKPFIWVISISIWFTSAQSNSKPLKRKKNGHSERCRWRWNIHHTMNSMNITIEKQVQVSSIYSNTCYTEFCILIIIWAYFMLPTHNVCMLQISCAVHKYQCKNVLCVHSNVLFHSDNFGIFYVHFWLCVTCTTECMENWRALSTSLSFYVCVCVFSFPQPFFLCVWLCITSYRHFPKSCKLLIKFWKCFFCFV